MTKVHAFFRLVLIETQFPILSQMCIRDRSREEVEAGLHPEHTSRTSDKKATNPNDPFWLSLIHI